MLPTLYQQALAGAPRREAQPLNAADQALLEDPTAKALWKLLQERYPQQALDLNMNLSLELNVDSFAWMELTITLQDRFAIQLNEAEITGIDTIRDLLHRCVDKARSASEAMATPRAAEDRLSRWLAPTGLLLTLLGLLLYGINWCAMRVFFGLRV